VSGRTRAWLKIKNPDLSGAICNRIGSQINHSVKVRVPEACPARWAGAHRRPFCFGLTHPRRETGGVFLGTYEMVCCRTSIRSGLVSMPRRQAIRLSEPPTIPLLLSDRPMAFGLPSAT
jgi:hypothetical protein